ncbi:snare associated Golgi protein-domain-containing protein [Cristinia sonorae]|uniref:Golgi apparatus membrane protein TVP38 n=1 Tax=Cristinia sonorae TaxID=1940300 RepID=A0A8K0UJU2_9AGAR|nr:snare associated Golgi protein-domain-containing protein [Cristinia sonorae]
MSSPYQEYRAPYPKPNTTSPVYPYPPQNASTVSIQRIHSPDHDEPFNPYKPEPKSGSDAFTVEMRPRPVTRTPSPTPSEAAELKKDGVFDWQAMKSWRFWIRKEWTWYYVVGVILIVLVTLMTVYHKQIVNWLQPAANWMHDLPAGWIIPIAIFFVISFPPLFGHEILAVLCGVVWGLWIGFAITAAGTFLGEMGNFYAFKWCCRSRAEKMEKTDFSYASLARVVREGGFKIALIARFSAIPGHFTTAVFSTCGMDVWTFALAAFFSLPKQFATVYLGVALDQSIDGTHSTKDTIIKWTIIVLTTVVTIAAMWYIHHQMILVKPKVIYDRRKARQQKLNSSPYGVPSSSTYSPNDSESNLPLNPKSDGQYEHQQWDSSGRAVGYTGDPTLYAPQPHRLATRPFDTNALASSSTVTLAPPPPAEQTRFSPTSRPGAAQRQDTAQSWDAQATVGVQDVYQMTRHQSPPPPRNVAESPLPPKLPPPGSAPSSQPQSPRININAYPVPTPPGLSQSQTYPQYTAPHGAPLPNSPTQNMYNPFDDVPPGASNSQTTMTSTSPLPPPSQSQQYPAYSPPKYEYNDSSLR